MSDSDVIGNARRAIDCVIAVRDHSVPPAPHLVTEEPKSTSRAGANRSFRDYTTLSAIPSDGSLLDNEPTLWHLDYQR